MSWSRCQGSKRWCNDLTRANGGAKNTEVSSPWPVGIPFITVYKKFPLGVGVVNGWQSLPIDTEKT